MARRAPTTCWLMFGTLLFSFGGASHAKESSLATPAAAGADVDAQLPEVGGDNARGARLLVAEFRVLVEVAPPRHDPC